MPPQKGSRGRGRRSAAGARSSGPTVTTWLGRRRGRTRQRLPRLSRGALRPTPFRHTHAGAPASSPPGKAQRLERPHPNRELQQHVRPHLGKPKWLRRHQHQGRLRAAALRRGSSAPHSPPPPRLHTGSPLSPLALAALLLQAWAPHSVLLTGQPIHLTDPGRGVQQGLREPPRRCPPRASAGARHIANHTLPSPRAIAIPISARPVLAGAGKGEGGTLEARPGLGSGPWKAVGVQGLKQAGAGGRKRPCLGLGSAPFPVCRRTSHSCTPLAQARNSQVPWKGGEQLNLLSPPAQVFQQG